MTLAPKVCILTETYYPVVGGGETQARALAEGLVARGHQVLVLTRRSSASLKSIERFGEITVYRLAPAGSAHLNKWGLLLTSLPALIRLRRQYDLVFVSGFRVLGIPAVLISKLLGKGCVLKADSLGEMSGDFFAAGLAQLRLSPTSLPFRTFLLLRNGVLRRADAFVAICSEVARELVAGGVRQSKIQMIPNSVDTTRFRPVDQHQKRRLRVRLGISQEEKIVIFTGRLVSYKGLPLLLRVWREIARRHKRTRLLLVGSGGLDIHNCEAELRTYVDAHALRRSVRFTGSVDNVHEFVQASDIFVFPSENEAFPISLIEGMACGLPVISTPVGGVKDVLEHQYNGLVVQPGDFQELDEALDALITDSSLSARLGQAARRTVQHKYCAERVTQQYAELFERIVNSTSGGPAPDRPDRSKPA